MRLACLATLLAATPALASPCSEKFGALDKRVDAQSREAISASTGGKGVAAKREGEGVTGTEGQRAGEAPQAPAAASAEAGKGADAAQQARVALNEARTADGKGDAAACEAAVTRAEGHLKAAP
ncbi:hypothetical protein Q8W71_08750 [Methylobacterium sp. NEAU 140]|uniref:hypothetical protein n=1 Tax=Methylobacterium sp. NEAU 140 TaxID=3064945 RepID=UPI0027366848|nr:hypothetical protein [Methylobacterium sp. NEAU 140]MDP4022709.1 hypothetical protein [Methylobacterium sp. NEAU 140]